jgi:hypothetical protein
MIRGEERGERRQKDIAERRRGRKKKEHTKYVSLVIVLSALIREKTLGA